MAFLSFPEAKFQLPKFEEAQIAKFRGFGFNSDTAVSTFNFSFTSCFLSLFLSHFFSFAGHLLAFTPYFGEEILGKTFSIRI